MVSKKEKLKIQLEIIQKLLSAVCDEEVKIINLLDEANKCCAKNAKKK